MAEQDLVQASEGRAFVTLWRQIGRIALERTEDAPHFVHGRGHGVEVAHAIAHIGARARRVNRLAVLTL